ncbi:UV radiation resistance-associated gene protein [Aplysia californica]|uniref:UV radiation resistance-associated gene protein n=1 Tax=Aplysia californica TaxID=6500 RepID=A0ABM0K779_APLCA|nr:UV radiation resistance-associated gene protein [Aplysia californica]
MHSSEDFPVVKSPFNLQTYQRRLRHLQSIAVRNLRCPQDADLDFSSLQVFFTLHTNEKSNAFYTSERITGSLNPTWQSFDLHRFDSEVDLTSKFLVVRVWMGNGQTCKVKIECHVCLSGLVFFANSLQVPGIKHPTNTFLFGMYNFYFFHYNATATTPLLDHWVLDKEVPRNKVPAVVSVDQSQLQPSYNLNYLSRIHTVRRAIKQTQASVTRIHSSIEDRLLSSTENSEKLSQREMLEMKVRQLRRELLWQTQQRQAEEEKLEKFKAEQDARLEKLRKDHTHMTSRGNKCEEDRTLHIQSREMLVKENAQVQYRRKQIISEMAHYIYPINEDEKQNFYIVKVKLPNAEDYQGQDETRVAVALGFTCHLTQMLSHFMDMPLRYPMVHRGSRSLIIDHVHSKLADKDREFPLYSKGKEKFQFNYAVFLLNKNVSQLRFYCGMGTPDLRQTLPNLRSFLEQRLGVRPPSSAEQRKSTPLQSPPTTSIGGSQNSRRSQALSSPSSGYLRKDITADYDSAAPSTRGGDGNSVVSEGISMADMDGTNSTLAAELPKRPKLIHSMSCPQSARPLANGIPSSVRGAADPSAPSNGHSSSASPVREASELNNDGGQRVVSSKAGNKNIISEEDEREDIFKPSNDNFFQVTVPSSVSAFRHSVSVIETGTPPLAMGLNRDEPSNGVVIPTSENLTDNDQRTFKLVRTPAIPVTSPTASENKSTAPGALEPLGEELPPSDNGASSNGEGSFADPQNSYSQSCSFDDSEMYMPNEQKAELSVLEQ